jgi:hypothetical protein
VALADPVLEAADHLLDLGATLREELGARLRGAVAARSPAVDDERAVGKRVAREADRSRQVAGVVGGGAARVDEREAPVAKRRGDIRGVGLVRQLLLEVVHGGEPGRSASDPPVA